MSKVSTSSQRHTFLKNAYIKKCEQEGRDPDAAYLKMWEDTAQKNLEWAQQDHKNDMEWDLRTTDWILEKVRASDTYAQNLYAAICNNEFQRIEVISILKDETWSCSWRHAGGIVADMKQVGDYIDWYCSGIDAGLNDHKTDFVSESVVTNEVRHDLKQLGWKIKG